MGSGTTRKGNDRTRINTPAKAQAATGSQAGGEAIDINQGCPMAFRVRTREQLQPDQRVELAGAEMQVSGKSIGKLPPARAAQVERCKTQGITYAGKTENDDGGKTSVRFEQVD